MFAYTVHCQHSNPAICEQWIAWMVETHLADVCAGGAQRAELIVDGLRCETRYTFADADAFERYEREHAPQLRTDGLERFPLSLGLVYTRTTGFSRATVTP